MARVVSLFFWALLFFPCPAAKCPAPTCPLLTLGTSESRDLRHALGVAEVHAGPHAASHGVVFLQVLVRVHLALFGRRRRRRLLVGCSGGGGELHFICGRSSCARCRENGGSWRGEGEGGSQRPLSQQPSQGGGGLLQRSPVGGQRGGRLGPRRAGRGTSLSGPAWTNAVAAEAVVGRLTKHRRSKTVHPCRKHGFRPVSGGRGKGLSFVLAVAGAVTARPARGQDSVRRAEKKSNSRRGGGGGWREGGGEGGREGRERGLERVVEGVGASCFGDMVGDKISGGLAPPPSSSL